MGHIESDAPKFVDSNPSCPQAAMITDIHIPGFRNRYSDDTNYNTVLPSNSFSITAGYPVPSIHFVK